MVGVMAVDQRRLEMYRDDRGKRIMEKVLCQLNPHDAFVTFIILNWNNQALETTKIMKLLQELLRCLIKI